MVSNTFTAVALSASITGIETHRHLGEKRYEIKDHLGNVRAVVSDIKNADDYTLSSSSWKFLADVRSLSNYYPYGLKINEGSWSSSNYQFAYNGKQEEPFNKNFLNFGARSYNLKNISTLRTDPHQVNYPDISPYSMNANNPIIYIDPDGKDIIFYNDAFMRSAHNIIKLTQSGKEFWDKVHEEQAPDIYVNYYDGKFEENQYNAPYGYTSVNILTHDKINLSEWVAGGILLNNRKKIADKERFASLNMTNIEKSLKKNSLFLVVIHKDLSLEINKLIENEGIDNISDELIDMYIFSVFVFFHEYFSHIENYQNGDGNREHDAYGHSKNPHWWYYQDFIRGGYPRSELIEKLKESVVINSKAESILEELMSLKQNNRQALVDIIQSNYTSGDFEGSIEGEWLK